MGNSRTNILFPNHLEKKNLALLQLEICLTALGDKLTCRSLQDVRGTPLTLDMAHACGHSPTERLPPGPLQEQTYTIIHARVQTFMLQVHTGTRECLHTCRRTCVCTSDNTCAERDIETYTCMLMYTDARAHTHSDTQKQ